MTAGSDDSTLAAEDVAVLRVFSGRPTGPMTVTLLSARTLLPLSVVTASARRLVHAGLLVETKDVRGRASYGLRPATGLTGRGKNRPWL